MSVAVTYSRAFSEVLWIGLFGGLRKIDAVHLVDIVLELLPPGSSQCYVPSIAAKIKSLDVFDH
jgi:hypothetical protein